MCVCVWGGAVSDRRSLESVDVPPVLGAWEALELQYREGQAYGTVPILVD